MKHPIVEAIRQARDTHAKQFKYDLDAICDDLRKREKEPAVPTVSLPPKRSLTKKRAPRHAPDTVPFSARGI